MQIGTFRKNVMKTVATRPAKLGLKTTARNTVRTNMAHSAVALKAHTGDLVKALSQYVLGLQFSQEMKENAFAAMGDMGYDLTVLCRTLKVKMPASTKKSKLVGTRTAALMALDGLTTDLLAIANKGLFAGPHMKAVQKEVVLPNKGGAKEMREVFIVDTEKEGAAQGEREAQMKSILSGIVDLYWRLSFEMFGHAPAAILQAKFDRLKAAYPAIQFDVAEVVDEEEKAEETQEAAATPAQ